MAARLSFLKSPVFIFIAYIVITLIAGIHLVWLGPDHYKNYLIFRTSFYNLAGNHDLYSPQSYGNTPLDFFKYSPAFSVLFAPWALLPDRAGVIAWNLFNVICLLAALRKLLPEGRPRWIAAWLMVIETLTSVQNCQSNILMAALMIGAFNAFERKKPAAAALFIALSAYIKIFSLAFLLLAWLYPGKKKFISFFLLCTLALFALPLLIISCDQLIFLYKQWVSLLKDDQQASWGLSVMGIIRSWSGYDPPKIWVQLSGLILLMLPLINIKAYGERAFRLLFLSAMLIWVVIFNHRAESPTFIIAMAGIVTGYCSIRQPGIFDKGLIILAIVLISLSPTDIFPKFARDHYVVPYALKALPALLWWMVFEYRMMVFPIKWYEPRSKLRPQQAAEN